MALHLKEFDRSAPGSFRQQQRYRGIMKGFKRAQEANDQEALLDVVAEFESLIIARLYTDDDTSVDAALDELSIDDWQLLVQSAGQTTEDAVPLESTPS